MKTYLLKVMFLVLTTASVVSPVIAQGTPSIETMDPWPNDLGHGDYLYMDAVVSDVSTDTDVWFEVKRNDELVGKATLTDYNNDAYYVSPSGVKVEGGNTYDIEVNACNGDSCISENTELEAACILGLGSICLH